MSRGDSSYGRSESASKTASSARRRGFLKAVGAGATAGLAGCIGGGGGSATISIYTWEEYGGELKKSIEDTLGVTLDVTKGTSSNKMFSAFRANPSQYDIVIPNNNYVPKMMKAGIVAPVNKEVMSNWGSMYGKFHEFANNQFSDGSDIYGVPIRFGWYGISYDSRAVKSPEKSYSELWNEDNKGNIIMYDNHFKSMSAAALKLGYTDAFSGAKVSLSDKQIEKVKQELIKQKELLQGYIAADPTYIKSLKQGNHTIGLSGRNEIVEMWANGTDWPQIYVPKEGSLAWFEGGVVSKESQNKEMAWKVINEYISPKVGAKLAKVGYSPSCNPKTQQNLSKEQNEMYGSIKPARLDGFIPFKAAEKEDAWLSAWEEVKSA